MRSTVRVLATVLVALAACGPPVLSAPPAVRFRYGAPGPSMSIPTTEGSVSLSVVSGYMGIFQIHQESEVSTEVPPEALVTAMLREELRSRGVDVRPDGETVLGCRLDQLAIKFRNYAGIFSSTDTFAWIDLTCRASRAGQVFWEGPAYGRWHESLSGNIDLENEHIPRVLGPALQQVASQIMREIDPRSPARRDVALVGHLLASSDRDTRRLGILELGLFATPDTVRPLVSLLDDGDPLIRSAAAIGLGMVGTTEAMTPLLRHFASDPAMTVQWGTVAAVLLSHDLRAMRWLGQARGTITNDDVEMLADDVLAHAPAWQQMTPPTPAPEPPAATPPPATTPEPPAPPAPPAPVIEEDQTTPTAADAGA